MADSVFKNLGNLSPDMLDLLATVPITAPPAGIKSNFVDAPSRERLQTSVTSVFLAIALVFYLNRVYVKTRLMRSRSWDDVTLALAVLLTIGDYVVATLGATKDIMGRHIWDISVGKALTSRLPPVAYAILILTPWALLFLKMTFFLFYLHIFYRIRWVRICSWVGTCYVVLSMSAIGIYTFVIGNPHENVTWATAAIRLGVPMGIVGLVADIVIFIIPFAAIIPLQISNAKRVGALLIFMTGGSAIICAVLNIYYRSQLEDSRDPLWDGVPGYICSICELLLGIICACLPATAYGFRHEGSFYYRALHLLRDTASNQPNFNKYDSSQYGSDKYSSKPYSSKPYSSKHCRSSISTPASDSHLGAANGGLFDSRSKIRSTTSLDIQNDEAESTNSRDGAESAEDGDIELAVLPRAHFKGGGGRTC